MEMFEESHRRAASSKWNDCTVGEHT